MGAKYRKVDPKIWNDEIVDNMTKDEVFCMLWLLTSNVTNRCGISVFSLGDAADRNRLEKQSDALALVQRVSEKLDWPMEKVTRSTVVMVLPKFFLYNTVYNEKHLKGVLADLHETPRCDVVRDNIDRLKSHVASHLHAVWDTLWHTLWHTQGSGYAKPVTVSVPVTVSGNSTKKVERQINDKETTNKIHGCTTSPCTVCEHYKTHHPTARPGDKERKLIRDRLKEGYTVDDLKRAIDGCHRTPHNLGDNERGTKYLSLSLIMRSSSHVIRFLENADNPVPVVRKGSSQNFDAKRTDNGDPDFGVM